ncbi:MAG: Murein DD-endopeptidase MepM [Bacteroidetes bacterium ADurb.Bin408]|nr:MAG: Murein DD-endopeptidase MepM [Bacteroidetes bacterium ADurb.Bin408]
MAKTKYLFDHKSLTYKEVTKSFKEILRKVVFIFSGFLVFSTIAVILAFYFVDSPKEKMLRREIEQYKKQYKNLNEKLDNISAVLKDLQERDDNIYRVILEAEPISEAERNAGIGGGDKYAELQGYNNSELLIAITSKLDKLSRQIYVQSKSYDDVFAMAKNKTDMLLSIPSIVPIANGPSRLHTGVDFTAPKGSPVYASGDGTVRAVNRRDFSGYGVVCIIDHGYGYQTLYAHLSKMTVRPGQKVKRGEVIGSVGSTGLSVGPHLHYEVLKNGIPINPVNFFYNDLTPEEYEVIIEEASKVNQALS